MKRERCKGWSLVVEGRRVTRHARSRYSLPIWGPILFTLPLADKSAEVVRMRVRPDCGSIIVTGVMVSDASVPSDVPAPEDPAAAEDDEAAGWDEPPMPRRRRWSLLTAFSTVFSTASHRESSGFSVGNDSQVSCSRLGAHVLSDKCLRS